MNEELRESKEKEVDVWNLSFEESLTKLEEIVKQLEDGNLPLEDSLGLFECGIRFSRRCRELLDNAKHRVDLLTEEGFEPFEDEV
ncbi:MAG: exodeoxyribonuclease VII small subunit [Methanosarcinales archaeon]|nr:MAG: exodeoxyribonuclease VII small subunit [Methanosarcinales archaeon]